MLKVFFFVGVFRVFGVFLPTWSLFGWAKTDWVGKNTPNTPKHPPVTNNMSVSGRMGLARTA